MAHKTTTNAPATTTNAANAPANDPVDLLSTLKITKTDGRKVGGVWVTGTIAGHSFDALVFPEHAQSESYELGQSRISKLSLKDQATNRYVASFDRGWDVKPTNDIAKQIIDLLDAGLAESVFGI